MRDTVGEGPLQQEIATSLEEVDALLKSNAKLSVAYLAERVRRLEETVKAIEAKADKRCRELDDRLTLAARKFRELQERMDEQEKRL